jgi:hypothetical protein
VIADCRTGRIERHYQPGHPHAFVSACYMGEVVFCRPLSDPSGILQALREQTRPYPQPLRRALVGPFLREARFVLAVARHGRAVDDPAFVIGCCYRCLACLCQVLFAIDGTYLLNEKGAVEGAERLAACPAGFAARAGAAFRDDAAGRTSSGVQQLTRLVEEIEAMAP